MTTEDIVHDMSGGRSKEHDKGKSNNSDPSSKGKGALPPFKPRTDSYSGTAEAGPSSASASTPLLLDFDDDFTPPPSKAGDADEELPPYTEDPEYVGEEPPPFSRYSPRKHFLTNGKTVSHDAHLNTDVEALFQWLHAESESPPRPQLHIEGHHTRRSTVRENGKMRTTTSTVTDFSMYFDLSTFIQPGCTVLSAEPTVKRRRGTRNARVATQGETEMAMDVRDWCDAYIRCPAWLKEFVLRKRLDGLREDMLRTHAEAIIRSTNYRGTVNITFPIENRSVVLSPDNWVCRIRYSWYRWIFYLTFLWLITWPLLWLFTKRWEVVEAVYETKPEAEREWVDRWGFVVTRLVRQKRQQRDALTHAHLRWIEVHELAERERLELRLQGGFGGVWGFLRGLRNMREAIGGGWGGDEWC